MLPEVLAGRLSYDTYAQLPADGRRWEFLDGEVHVTPAPSPAHQFTVVRLSHALDACAGAFGGGHVVLVSPVDVILADDEIVQPDVVVARSAQLSPRGIEGTPPLIAEVLSPGRPSLDRDVKARRYAAHGVPRYWIVDPLAHTLECYALHGGGYVLQRRGNRGDTLALDDLPGLAIDLARLWLP
jgi:Uma2 family endonuclease